MSTTTTGTVPAQTAAEIDAALEAAWDAMSVDDLLRAVVTEMNCRWPGNALQNGMLAVSVTPTGVEVHHPEWTWPLDFAMTLTPAPTLGQALRAMLRALYAGTMNPRHLPQD